MKRSCGVSELKPENAARTSGLALSFARTAFFTRSSATGSVLVLSRICTETPFELPRPGIAGGANTCHFGSGIAARTAETFGISAARLCDGSVRSLQRLRSTMSMARFSPRPEIMPKPVIERMLDTSGILRSSSTARSETSRVRSRDVPSGMSIAQKITLWSSSGRNEVSVSMKRRAVRRIVSTSSTAARKMRLATSPPSRRVP